MSRAYSIGKFSQVTGISEDTIRHYERCGLLRPRVDPENNYRFYSERDAFQLFRIRMCRGFDMPVPAIQNVFEKSPFDDELTLLAEASHKLERELARLRLLYESCDARKRSIQHAREGDRSISTLELPPACHLYPDDCKHLPRRESAELLRLWADCIPFVMHMFCIDKADVLAGRAVLPRLGLGSRLRIVEEFGLPIVPPARMYAGGRGLRRRMVVDDPFAVGPKELAPMLEQMDAMHCALNGDAVFLVDAVDPIEGGERYYIDLHFQIKPRD